MKNVIKKLFKIGEYQKEKNEINEYISIRETLVELGLIPNENIFKQVIDKLYINGVKFKPSVNRIWYSSYNNSNGRTIYNNEITIFVDKKNTKENYNLKYVLPDIKIINNKYKYHISTFNTLHHSSYSSTGEFTNIYRICDSVLNLQFTLIIRNK